MGEKVAFQGVDKHSIGSVGTYGQIQTVESKRYFRKLRLIKLTKEYETQLKEMIEEWKADIIANNTNRSPWVIFKNDCNDFIHYLENLETKEETDCC